METLSIDCLLNCVDDLGQILEDFDGNARKRIHVYGKFY